MTGISKAPAWPQFFGFRHVIVTYHRDAESIFIVLLPGL